MKNWPPACERQSCWHRVESGRPEAQKEHKVPHWYHPTICMQAMSFNSVRSQLLKAAAQNISVFPSRASTCHSSCVLGMGRCLFMFFYYFLKYRQSGNAVLLYFWIVFSYSRKANVIFKSFYCVHKDKENKITNTDEPTPFSFNNHQYFTNMVSSISSNLLFWFFSWNILKQNQDTMPFY